MSVQPIPAGYHSVTPYLILKDATAAIEFYKRAFGATELMRLDGPGGTVAHAEVKIGDSPIMLSDEWPNHGILGPAARGGTTVGLMVYVEDCDAVFERAIAAGGTVDRPLENQFYGDRSGTIIDPFGHKWTIASHIEDVPPEEINRRFEEWMATQSAAATPQGE
jgi:PhnB protein